MKRLEIHHTPKHGSWLNIAEIELSLITRQCLVTALVANKGTANVPSASSVVLVVLLTSIGLSVEAITLIAGIDYFGSMSRTTINVFR